MPLRKALDTTSDENGTRQTVTTRTDKRVSRSCLGEECAEKRS